MKQPMILSRTLLIIATTVVTLLPLFPDLSPSHVFNDTWPGHARFHMVWLLTLMFLTGTSVILVTILYSRFGPRERLAKVLLIATAPVWLILIAFLTAILTIDLYHGDINAFHDEATILGLNGNSFSFALVACVLAAATLLIWREINTRD